VSPTQSRARGVTDSEHSLSPKTKLKVELPVVSQVVDANQPTTNFCALTRGASALSARISRLRILRHRLRESDESQIRSARNFLKVGHDEDCNGGEIVAACCRGQAAAMRVGVRIVASALF